MTATDRLCSVDGCDKVAKCRGWCNTHYSRWKRTGDVGPADLLIQRGRVCSVDGCDKPHAALGYCSMHWRRHKRTGDAGSAEPRYQPGRVCTVDDCTKTAKARGWCPTHYTRWSKHQDVHVVNLHGPGLMDEHPNWRGDKISYRTAHTRVTMTRGRAGEHQCDHCGDPAHEWAYDHEDPDALTNPRTGAPYSTDPGHYMPLCRSCHKRLDNQHRKAHSA